MVRNRTSCSGVTGYEPQESPNLDFFCEWFGKTGVPVIDSRVVRSRTALFEALLSLMLEQDYQAISIEDILTRADIGRSTFYAHFTCKDDLLEKSLERLRADLLASMDHQVTDLVRSGEHSLGFSRAFFEHVAGYRKYAMIEGRAGEIIRRAVGDVLTDLLRRALPAKSDSYVPRDLAIRHIVATFTTVQTWWLQKNPGLDAREVDRLFRQLVETGVDAEWLARRNCPRFRVAGRS